ncbi:MAG: hypothetical protein MJ203_05020 [archaeon]|nr:hypothetical protein [archaeon]
MDNSMKLFVGALLTGFGLIIIYESIAFRLIDVILFLGVLFTIIGVILLLSAFLERQYGYQLSNDISNFVEYKAKYIDGRNHNFKSNIKESVLGSNGINSSYHESPVLRPYGVRNEKSGASFFGPTRQSEFKGSQNRRPVKKIKKQSSRQILKTRPSFNKSIKEEPVNENKTRAPYRRYVDSENKHNVLIVREDYDENKVVPSLKDLNFTPNYEKPMKITRRPRKKSPDKIDIHNIPQRVQNDSKLVEENTNFLGIDESTLLEVPPKKGFKEVAEDVIVPIHNIEDDDVIIPIYNDANYNVTYAGYDYESDRVEYGYTNSIQEPVHVVEVYDSFDEITVEHAPEIEDDLPYDKEFVIDDIEEEKEEYVPSDFVKAVKSRQTTLNTEPVVPLVTETPISPVAPKESPIQIDPNNPESLPIPRLLNSYVICEKGILTSKDAFEEVATHAKSEILLEAPDIRDMGEVFLSALTKVNSRIILQDFDTDDLSYVLLISSLLKSGVQIRTAPVIEAFNLIGDLSHALIISNDDEEVMEYGAVFDDEESVKAIKELFETSWNLAKDLDYIN